MVSSIIYFYWLEAKQAAFTEQAAVLIIWQVKTHLIRAARSIKVNGFIGWRVSQMSMGHHLTDTFRPLWPFPNGFKKSCL